MGVQRPLIFGLVFDNAIHKLSSVPTQYPGTGPFSGLKTDDKIVKAILKWTGRQWRMHGVNRIVCISLCLEVKQNKDNRQNSSTLGWRIWIFHQNCKWLTDWLSHLFSSQSVLVVSTVTDEQGIPLPQLCGDQSGAAALALVVTVSALDSQESLWDSRWKRFGGTSLFFPLLSDTEDEIGRMEESPQWEYRIFPLVWYLTLYQ